MLFFPATDTVLARKSTFYIRYNTYVLCGQINLRANGTKTTRWRRKLKVRCRKATGTGKPETICRLRTPSTDPWLNLVAWELRPSGSEKKAASTWSTFLYEELYCPACCVSSTWTESWIPKSLWSAVPRAWFYALRKKRRRKHFAQYFALRITVEISAKRVWQV